MHMTRFEPGASLKYWRTHDVCLRFFIRRPVEENVPEVDIGTDPSRDSESDEVTEIISSLKFEILSILKEFEASSAKRIRETG
jgi:hypothetical protein